jgi:outer membrane biosynthesis protein TonB
VSATRSNLDPLSWTTDALWLAVWIVPSIVGHLLIVAVLMLLSALPSCQQKPLMLEDVVEVSLVVLPKSDSKMAQMDVRTKTPPAPVIKDAPPPEKDPGLTTTGKPEPTPPNPSDLVIRDPKVQPKGDPDREARETERREALRRLAMANLDAPEGTKPSTAADPDGTSDERINLGGTGVLADPELARYAQRVRELFMSKFNPLPTIREQNPNIEGILRVRFDVDTGKVKSWEWVKRSGNPSWDGASERAVEAITVVPIPPAKYKNQFIDGYLVRFNAS